MLKTFVELHIAQETERLKEQHLFEIEILEHFNFFLQKFFISCNILIFTDTFKQFNVFLLNKSKKKKKSFGPQTEVYFENGSVF